MNCERFRYWISLKADGRLDAARAAELSSHLQACGSCREFEQAIENARARLRTLPEAAVGDSFTRAVLEEARSPSPARPRHGIVPAVAAGILITVLALYLMPRGPKPAPADPSAARDRAWLLLAQVANESIERPSRVQEAFRAELAAASLPEPPPDAVKDAAEILDRIRRYARAAPAAGDLKRLQQDIRSSGLLRAWRPDGLPASGPRPDEPSDGFRRARGLLYAGQVEPAVDHLRAYLGADPEPELQDDALFWIAFIEARRNRAAEALGALYSLWGFDSTWMDASTIDEAQRLTMGLAESKGAARLDLPMWTSGGEGGGPGWMTIDVTPDEAWCAFETARGNKGGKAAPVAIEFKGVRYEAKNLDEFRARHPGIVSFLQSRMPAVLKFLEEGAAEFEIQMPDRDQP